MTTANMPDFDEMVTRYHKRIAQCKRIYDRDGRLLAEYGARPSVGHPRPTSPTCFLIYTRTIGH